jgi:hypothetical protein
MRKGNSSVTNSKYYLATLLKGCEAWHLNASNMHKIHVAWNNLVCCSNIFSCCWRERESVKPLHYFCQILPVSYLSHQRKLLIWKKLLYFNNTVLLTLSRFLYNDFVVLGSLYGVAFPVLSANSIRLLVWVTFDLAIEL